MYQLYWMHLFHTSVTKTCLIKTFTYRQLCGGSSIENTPFNKTRNKGYYLP